MICIPLMHLTLIHGIQVFSSPTSYGSNNLLNALIGRLGLKNDASLARMLEVALLLLSKIRHRPWRSAQR
jgi:hypothetical protein